MSNYHHDKDHDRMHLLSTPPAPTPTPYNPQPQFTSAITMSCVFLMYCPSVLTTVCRNLIYHCHGNDFDLYYPCPPLTSAIIMSCVFLIHCPPIFTTVCRNFIYCHHGNDHDLYYPCPPLTSAITISCVFLIYCPSVFTTVCRNLIYWTWRPCVSIQWTKCCMTLSVISLAKASLSWNMAVQVWVSNN